MKPSHRLVGTAAAAVAEANAEADADDTDIPWRCMGQELELSWVEKHCQDGCLECSVLELDWCTAHRAKWGLVLAIVTINGL